MLCFVFSLCHFWFPYSNLIHSSRRQEQNPCRSSVLGCNFPGCLWRSQLGRQPGKVINWYFIVCFSSKIYQKIWEQSETARNTRSETKLTVTTRNTGVSAANFTNGSYFVPKLHTRCLDLRAARNDVIKAWSICNINLEFSSYKSTASHRIILSCCRSKVISIHHAIISSYTPVILKIH